MSKKEESSYTNARKAFDDLEVDEKARFMVEAMMSTFAEGIDRLAQVVNERFDAASNGEVTDEGTTKTKSKSKSKPKSKSKSKSKKGSTDESASPEPDVA